MIVNNEKRLTLLVILIPIMSIVFFTILITYFFINEKHKQFEKESAKIKEEFIASKNEYIKEKVYNVVDYIKFKKQNAQKELKSTLKERVYLAYNIAKDIFEKNKNIKSQKEIENQIIQTLRSITFDNGRGYIYILHDKSDKEIIAKLLPATPQNEGKNRFDTHDSKGKYIVRELVKICRSKEKEGYSRYFWLKKDYKKDKLFEKISFVKSFEPYNWIIGSGEYLDNFNKKLQEDTKEWIDKIRFGKSGYIFVYELLNIEGGEKFAKMAVNPNRPDLIGKYLSDSYKDAKGKMFRKEFLKGIRENGESFVSYYYKKLNDPKPKPKIAFFKLYKDWNWIVATGMYIDELDQIIADKKKELKDKIAKDTKFIITTSSILLIVFSILSLFLSRSIISIYNKYKQDIIKKEMDLENKNKELISQLYTDELTGLKNRKALMKRLKRVQYPMVMIIDIDSFKNINELYGVETGNEILKQLAKKLKIFSQGNGYGFDLFRIGSDEFALLNDKEILDIEYYEECVEKLLLTVKTSRFFVSHIQENIDIDITIGISLDNSNSLKKADIALQRAKNDKKSYLCYSKTIDSTKEIENIISWKKEIIKAIKEEHITPYFQPIVDKNGNIIKYECLIRLLKEKDGLLKAYSPQNFLDIAIKTKLYPQLAKIVLEKSFAMFSGKGIDFSVNLSTSDIVQKETLHFIKDKLKEYDVKDHLIFEITESEGIDDFKNVKEFIDEVKKMGIKIAIDDFGSGYSNFTHILNIDPHYLKIDGTLIKSIDKDSNSLAIVKTIVIFAKELGIKTIAEYVHSREIFDIVKKTGVDEFQGYYFGKSEPKLKD
jgi:diguanylate cyclase (GGDEF)-like protein